MDTSELAPHYLRRIKHLAGRPTLRLLYPSRFDQGERCVALFDRVAGDVEVVGAAVRLGQMLGEVAGVGSVWRRRWMWGE